MSTLTIKLSDFTETPGSRFRHQHSEPGHSGEEFREQKIIPALKDAMSNKSIILVDLDNVAGWPITFIDEAFGKLGNVFTFDLLKEHLFVSCKDDPAIVLDVWECIKDYVISHNPI